VTSGHYPRPVPRQPSAQIRLPVLLRWHVASSRSGANDPGRSADRSDGCPCSCRQVCRSPFVVLAGRDLQPQGAGLDRSTLADWVDRAAFELRFAYCALMANPKRSRSCSGTNPMPRHPASRWMGRIQPADRGGRRPQAPRFGLKGNTTPTDSSGQDGARGRAGCWLGPWKQRLVWVIEPVQRVGTGFAPR